MTFISNTFAKEALSLKHSIVYDLLVNLLLFFVSHLKIGLSRAHRTPPNATTSARVMRNNDVKCGRFIAASRANGFRAAIGRRRVEPGSAAPFKAQHVTAFNAWHETESVEHFLLWEHVVIPDAVLAPDPRFCLGCCGKKRLPSICLTFISLKRGRWVCDPLLHSGQTLTAVIVLLFTQLHGVSRQQATGRLVANYCM